MAKEDVTEIILTPRKISRDNGGRSDYHLDCALSVTCKKDVHRQVLGAGARGERV